MTRVSVPDEKPRSIGYDPVTQVLEIGLLDGGAWRFFGVPIEVAGRLLGTFPPAEAVITEMRAHYRASRW
jgi:hypothetical protein